jgi:hypothetical protein
MQNPPKTEGSRSLAVGLCVLAFSAGLQIQAASAEPARAKPQTHANAAPSAAGGNAVIAANTAQKPMYYVDFRARTAASYGHAFTWYGRTDQKQVEVAGLHPASESMIPYVLGHVIPVLSETGASYGDLDPQYVTASYRVLMDEAQAKRVFAYIKHLQATSPVWNAAAYNCVAFIQDIARYMGLRVPGTHLIYPEDWVNQLRALNGGAKMGRMPGMAADQAQTPSTLAPATQRSSAPARATQKPSAPASARTAEMSTSVSTDQFRLMD